MRYAHFGGTTPIELVNAEYRKKIDFTSVRPNTATETTPLYSDIYEEYYDDIFVPLNKITLNSGDTSKSINIPVDLYSTGMSWGTDTINYSNEYGFYYCNKKTYILDFSKAQRDTSAFYLLNRILVLSNIRADSEYQQVNLYFDVLEEGNDLCKIPRFLGHASTDIIPSVPWLYYNDFVTNGYYEGYTTRLKNGKGYLVLGIAKSRFIPNYVRGEEYSDLIIRESLINFLIKRDNFVFRILYGTYEAETLTFDMPILTTFVGNNLLNTNVEGSIGGYYWAKTDDELEMKFYSSLCEDIVVDKTNYLENGISFKGTLKSSCSIINPVVQISAKYFTEYDYCYIPLFRRYYFINNIVSLNNGLWEISMSVDVLMSHKDDILQQKALVGRNEFEFNPMLIDNNIKCEYKYEIDIQKVAGFASWDNDRISNFNDEFSYALSYVSASDTVVGTSSFYGENSSFNNIAFMSDNIYSYVVNKLINPSYKESLLNLFENLSDNIQWVKLLPFNIRNIAYADNDVIAMGQYNYVSAPLNRLERIEIGSGSISLLDLSDRAYTWGDTKGIPITLLFCQSHTYNGTTNIYEPIHINPKFNSFLDYAPYTTIEIFLPYIGFVEVNPQLVMDKDFYICYIIDPINFDCDAVLVYNTDILALKVNGQQIMNSDDVVAIWTGNISIDLPIGGNNKNEIYRQLTNIGVQLGSSLIGKGISFSTSLRQSKDVARQRKRGSALRSRDIRRSAQEELQTGLVTDMGETALGLLNNVPKGYGGDCNGSGTSRLYGGEMFIRITRINAEYPENYNHLYGRPLFETRELSNVHGYTVISDMHLESFFAMNDEKDEIISLLESGVILP